MKAVILAGGLGTRISEETVSRPKPMVEIGGRPILWHIMKSMEKYSINEFIVCCGYKGQMIKDYFIHYSKRNSDITIDTRSGSITLHKEANEDWKVTLIDTGDDSQTGGRLKAVEEYIDDNRFIFTYGDGLSDVNITNLIEFHNENSSLATVTAVKPPGRYGALALSGNKVSSFDEKPEGDNLYINGGFFCLERSCFEFISDKFTIWEREPLEKMASQSLLSAYIHDGFWAAMDTLRDKRNLEEMWLNDSAPWKWW